MSAAQQNVASADFNSFLSSAKELGGWAWNGAKQGIKSAWSNPYVKFGVFSLLVIGLLRIWYKGEKEIKKYKFYLDMNEKFSKYLSYIHEKNKLDENLRKFLLGLMNRLINDKDTEIKFYLLNGKEDEVILTVSAEDCFKALCKLLDENLRNNKETLNFDQKTFGDKFLEKLKEVLKLENTILAWGKIKFKGKLIKVKDSDRYNVESGDLDLAIENTEKN